MSSRTRSNIQLESAELGQYRGRFSRSEDRRPRSLSENRIEGNRHGHAFTQPLLGGNVNVESDVGLGSTFFASITIRFQGANEAVSVPEMKPELDSDKLPGLVVKGDREALFIEARLIETLFIYEKCLKNTAFQVIPATDLHEARQALRDFRPAAVVPDVLLQGERSSSLLEELKPTPSLRSIPVLVVAVVENREKALALGADGFYEKPVDRAWLLRQLESIAERQLGPQVLIIDDDEASRDLIKAVLAQGECRVLETAGGDEGLRACEDNNNPGVVVLDLATPDLSGFEVLRRLEQNPQTAAIPVIMHTSKIPDFPERSLLNSAVATISEEATSRELSLAHFAKAGFAFPARPGNEATHV